MHSENTKTYSVFLAGNHLEIKEHCGINVKFGATIHSTIWNSKDSTHYRYKYIIEILTNGSHIDIELCNNIFSWYIIAEHSGHYYQSNTLITVKGVFENNKPFTFTSIYNPNLHLIENYIYILLLLNSVQDERKVEELWSMLINQNSFSKLSYGRQLDSIIELSKVIRPICDEFQFSYEFFHNSLLKLKAIIKKNIDNLDI